MDRLSPLDASFLAVEGPTTPMHVGWVAEFDGSAPFGELADHIAGRLSHAPRYRQKLAGVPLGVHDPVWVDDAEFDAARHLRHAEGDLDAIVDDVLSTPLERDRPLWEMTMVTGERLALVGKMHHCMVDGVAVVQLGNLLLDPSPDAEAGEPSAWAPQPAPSARSRFVRGTLDRFGDAVALAAEPARAIAAPHRLPGTLARAARTGARMVLPPAHASPLNHPGSARRHHVRVTRRVHEVRTLRKRFRVTPNDVLLAACAGALRTYLEPQVPLKAMVPADVRAHDDSEGGNRISFVFLPLPTDEPDPVLRLHAVHRATAAREADGAAETLDSAFRTLARTPGPVQQALAHAFAHPRLFNLTVSSVPGPAVPRYLRGLRLDTVHSSVPLAGRHALSIGIVTVAGNACLGITADPDTLPDADALAVHLDAAFDELLAAV
jgi:diacylglycerol O-acyltransferase / wax synthase